MAVNYNDQRFQQVENATSGLQDINALKLQIKCLKKENDMLKNTTYSGYLFVSITIYSGLNL